MRGRVLQCKAPPIDMQMPDLKRPRLEPDASRVRRVAADSQALALHTATSPLTATSPYHAFAHSPPTALLGRPRCWPGPEASATTVRLLWNEDALFVCWELEGRAAPPVAASAVDPVVLAGLEGGRLRPEQRTVLLDERVECFLWQADQGDAEGPCIGQTYYAFEINHHGKALTNRAKFGKIFDFAWESDDAYAVWTQEMTVGWGASSSPVPTAVDGLDPPYKRVVAAEFRWKAMGIDPAKNVRIGLHRGQHGPGTQVDKLGKEEVEALLGNLVWSSWVDSGDSEVNFHRPAFFGHLVLAQPGSSGLDCSCCAARLLGARRLQVLPSPKPSLSECPTGSLVVQAKYSSLCGSDLPYFRSVKAPSCYWDRDGFCGHEVIGIVVESKSEHFKAGDAVMSLPSSYFKAHTGSKQEWYKEATHGVLLENFPVRGGFCQVYTSHELYTYKLQACEPRMLVAQGLGTVLRMARRLGPVLGKTVAVVGQGQNGLLATRLMAQFCAKHVVAIEPLEHRRNVAVSMGATHTAATTKEAKECVLALTDGKGADVVLEMVGHNQDTINIALDLVACAGTVVAFGVPDDKIYDHFEYTTFFRKNVNLMASVIPDPGVDFPEAVRLIEQGRFSTDGILSHVYPLSDVQQAFATAANYSGGVVKVVIDLS